MRKLIIVFSLILAGLIAYLLAFPFGAYPKPKVTVSLLGIENGATGRQARFVVTNESTFAVIRSVEYHLHAQTSEHGWANLIEDWFKGQGNLLPEGSEILIVPIPTNPPPWRLSLKVVQDVSLPTLMMRKARAKLRNATQRDGQNRDYHNPRHTVNSDWITD
jgi:hypothetical protein